MLLRQSPALAQPYDNAIAFRQFIKPVAGVRMCLKRKELACDFLPGFLKISVIDFVALNLFPFLYFTFAFLVATQIVYEKEQRLRVIMRMNMGG